MVTPPLSSSEVCRLTGVTVRQLDYWVRIGLLSPSLRAGYGGSGDPRRWSEADVAKVRVVAAIMSAKGKDSTGSLSRMARRVLEEVDAMAADGFVVVDADGAVTWAAGGTELAEACRTNGPGCWVLDLVALAGAAREAVA